MVGLPSTTFAWMARDGLRPVNAVIQTHFSRSRSLPCHLAPLIRSQIAATGQACAAWPNALLHWVEELSRGRD